MHFTCEGPAHKTMDKFRSCIYDVLVIYADYKHIIAHMISLNLQCTGVLMTTDLPFLQEFEGLAHEINCFISRQTALIEWHMQVTLRSNTSVTDK